MRLHRHDGPSPRTLAPRPPSSIEVLASGPPERPHVDVGMITVEEGDVGESSPQELLPLLRQNAAQAGLRCPGRVAALVEDSDLLAYAQPPDLLGHLRRVPHALRHH